MNDTWERAFVSHQVIWGLEPTASAVLAGADFTRRGVKSVLIPGIGYGRNAKPFLDAGMEVTGIEISVTAIGLARSKLGLELPIHHGSVADMPFDERRYDGIFCFGLLYLLDEPARAKLLADCARQLAPGGPMVFTLISKEWVRTGGGPTLFFYDEESIERELGPYGVVDVTKVSEPIHDGSMRPFLQVTCAGTRSA